MYDVLVIGGGVIGCAIARELSRRSGRICVVERNEDVCTGTSKANSAIVHAGFDAEPGTRKARFNVEGSRMMEALSRQLDFPYRRCGALVLCLDPADREKLQALYQRGLANGVEGLELVEGEALHRMEPALSQQAVAALYAPTSAILCPFGLTIALAENAAANGTEFRFDTQVQHIRREGDHFVVETGCGPMESRAVVNAAGVWGDVLHNQLCADPLHITPRRGEYCLLDRKDGGLVSRTIFQLPGAMGKGVLVTPTVHGNLLLGPTATDQQDRDDTATTQTGLDHAIATAGRSVPNLPMRDVITSFAGLRAIWRAAATTSTSGRAVRTSSRPSASSPPVCPPPRPSACMWRDWWRKSWALRKSPISSLSAGISSTCGNCRCRSVRRWWSGTPPTAISSAAVSRSARGRSGTPSAAVPAPVLWTASSAGSGPVWAGVREASAPPVSWSCCPRNWEFPRHS